MKQMIVIILILFGACSHKSEQKETSVSSSSINKTLELYYMEESGGRFVEAKGYRKKTDTEFFGPGLFSLTDTKRKLFVTSDLELLKWAIRVRSFIRAVDVYNGYVDTLHYVILKVTMDGKEAECLTSEPMQITGINNQFFSPSKCKIDETEKLNLFCGPNDIKITAIPTIDDVFPIDQTTFKEHCVKFNPKNRFMVMSRNTLMEKYFWKFKDSSGVYKFACSDEINSQFRRNLSETYNCEEIKIDREHNFDETPDFIYALIEKGIYFFKDRDFITTIDIQHPSFKED